jgi:hypothetical protein
VLFCADFRVARGAMPDTNPHSPPRPPDRLFLWPVAPFSDVIRWPLLVEEGARAGEPVPRYGQQQGEAARGRIHSYSLEGYANTDLRARAELPGRERHYGIAVDRAGAAVLIFVDYPLRDGEHIPDPDDSSRPLHRVYPWLSEPFGPVIDLARLER